MNMVRHDHITPECDTKIFNTPSTVGFERALRRPQVWNCPPISSAKRDKVGRIPRKYYVEALGAALDHVAAYIRLIPGRLQRNSSGWAVEAGVSPAIAQGKKQPGTAAATEGKF